MVFAYWSWIKRMFTYLQEAAHYTSGKIGISLLKFKLVKGSQDKNVSTLQYHEL